MRQLNLPILQALFSLMAGILFYDYIDIGLAVIGIATIVILVILVCLHFLSLKTSFSRLPFIFGVFTLFIIMGYATRERSNDLKRHDHYVHHSNRNDHSILFSIDQKLKPTRYQDKFIGDIHLLDSVKTTGKVLINLDKDSLSLLPKVGEWYHTRAQLLPLPKPKNLYQFDYGKYLERKEIYKQLSLDTSELLRSQNTTSGLWVWSSRFRESVQKSLHSYPFTDRQLAIMESLVLGQKQGLDLEISAQYKAAGMMHILAVSGLHVGIVLLLLRILFKPMNQYRLRFVKSAIIILIIWAFAFITGLSPSVMRAATMFTFLEVGTALGGKRKSRDAVLISALVLILVDPMLVYQVGFQLSYLAVVAILWIQPWLEGFWTPRYWLLKYLWGIATVTIAAQIGVMPLSLFYFHQFPGLFFISNIVILPFLGLILSGGIFVAFLAYVGFLPEWLVKSFGFIIDQMNHFIGWVASQENFVSTHISLSIKMLLISYLVFITFIRLFKKYSSLRLAFAMISIVLLTGIWMYEKHHLPEPHLAVLNKNRSTSLLTYEHNHLKISSPDRDFRFETDYSINAYHNALDIRSIEVDTLRNYFRFKQKELLIIDSLGIYDLTTAKPDFILLTQSPKINLNRIIDRFPKATLIADASNYRSFVDRWRLTCRQRKIPFHSTYEKGSYIIK